MARCTDKMGFVQHSDAGESGTTPRCSRPFTEQNTDSVSYCVEVIGSLVAVCLRVGSFSHLECFHSLVFAARSLAKQLPFTEISGFIFGRSQGVFFFKLSQSLRSGAA